MASPTTAKPPSDEKRATWQQKWLKLQTHHKQLQELADAAYSFCAEFAKRPTRGYRLVVHGLNGTGKSHVAKAISRWSKRMAVHMPIVGTEDGYGLAEVEYVWWPKFCDDLKGNWDLLDPLLSDQLVIIDDIGAEHDPSKVGIEKLYMVLERREWMWTVITTNVGPEAWESRFERRVASRLFRNSKIVSTADVPDFNAL